MSTGQAGVTLIEVLVALLVLAVGVLGVALLQANALKHTDSVMRRTQVGFIAHDLLERMRANPQANYALASLSEAPAAGNLAIPLEQDLFDFADQLKRAVGDDVHASVEVVGSRATINVDWNDSRAQGLDAQRRQTLTLSTLTAPEHRP